MDWVRTPAAAVAAVLMLTAARKPPPAPPPPATAAAPAPTIRAGVEKWRAGDYAAAVAIWAPFAAAGDADALFNLGQAYKLGRGVTADAATARDYYRKAAIKGHLPAQANLGIALFQAGDKVEAIRWLKIAADRGEARAQYVYGVAAFTGDSVPRSQSAGYGYLLRAKASGLPQAITALASFEPLLSPTDRVAGEAVAARLASGTAATPVLPPAPMTAATPSATSPATMPAAAATPPATVVPKSAMVAAPARPVATAAATPTATAAVVTPPPASQSAAPLQTRVHPFPSPRTMAPAHPTSALDATVTTTRPAVIATIDVPPSHSDPLASAAPPRPAVPPGPAPATPVRVAAAPAAPPRTLVLKPFETVVEPHRATGWRVQLGAFSARKQADTAWAAIKADAAPAKPIFATDGPVTKLQMGPFATRDTAKAACGKLTASGHACFVTPG